MGAKPQRLSSLPQLASLFHVGNAVSSGVRPLKDTFPALGSTSVEFGSGRLIELPPETSLQDPSHGDVLLVPRTPRRSPVHRPVRPFQVQEGDR